MAAPMKYNLTCRHWKLSPVSCLKGPSECPYAHHKDTEGLGPTANITCWAWKNGCCKLHEDGCLFSHFDTGIVQAAPYSAHPAPLTGRNLAIAKAAAKAGFDCSDPEKLMSLVNAVRQADSDAGRPSTHYPARRRQIHSYRDLDNPAVPAFTLDPNQILRNVQQWGGSFTYHEPRFGTSKRTATDGYTGAAKKLKTSRTTYSTRTNRIEIDLTQDDDDSAYVHPSRRDQVPRKNKKGNTNKPPPRFPKEQRLVPYEQDTGRITTRTLENISRSLSQSVKQIAESRDTLKKRWDLDRHLQLQSVTEQLGALNDCFTRSEDALKDSIAVIEDRLLR